MELRIKQSEYKRKLTNTDTGETQELQFLKVEIKNQKTHESEITRTLRFNKKHATVRDIFNTLIKKYQVDNVEEYGLWHTKEQRWLDLDMPLSECNLEYMELLTFGKKATEK